MLSSIEDFYRFGYISGMDIKIVPSYQGEILEVIGKSPSLITLLPGTRRLMVVHVHLDTTKTKKTAESQEYRPLTHNSKSDQLLEDLELQLGSTSREYLQVQLTYAHSGFPKRDVGRDPADRDGGCVEVRTTIETTVTALVMQQNSSSLWSPPPAPATGSPLVDIVAKHWGPAAAKEMARRIAISNDMRTLRHAGKTSETWDTAVPLAKELSNEWQPGTPGKDATDEKMDDLTPRAASQSKQLSLKSGDGTRRIFLDKSSPAEREDLLRIPVRKSKKNHRNESYSVEQLFSTSAAAQMKTPITHPTNLSMSSANIPVEADSPSPGCLLPRKSGRIVYSGPRQGIPGTAPRNIRRPKGADTANLRDLPHGASEQSLQDENCDGRVAAYSGLRSSSRSSTISKKSGKWSWPGWFS